MSDAHEGGCYCGAIRFVCHGEPEYIGYCHCKICRKISGAPVFQGVVFRREDVRILEGQPRRFQSSHRGVRLFCGDCGSHLFFDPLDKQEWLEVMIGAFDDPTPFSPRHHIWASRQLPWMKIEDDLPRHEKHDPPLDTPTGEALPPGGEPD